MKKRVACGPYMLLGALLLWRLSTVANAHGYHDKKHDPLASFNWSRSYPELIGQQWNSITLDEHDGYLYMTGKLETSSQTRIPCIHEETSNSKEDDSGSDANGVVCKLDVVNGDVKWCARSCDNHVPLFSSLSTGKDLVYVTGDKGYENVTVLGIHKYSALARMEKILDGLQDSRTTSTKGGTFVCGKIVDEQGSTGVYVSYITKYGFEVWSKEIRMSGLESCLGIDGLRNGRSVAVIGGLRHASKNNSIVAVKMDGEKGDIIWQTTLIDRNYSLEQANIVTHRQGVFVAASAEESTDDTLRVNVLKLGIQTGVKLWCKEGPEIAGLGAISFYNRDEVIVGSFGTGDVSFNVFGSYNAENLLGEGEHERAESKESVGNEALLRRDMSIGKANTAVLRETAQGGKTVHVTPLRSDKKKRIEKIDSDIRVRAKVNLILDVSDSAKKGTEATICEVVADAMKGRARMRGRLLVANGRLTKVEAEMIIKEILEDRGLDGRSYIESKLGLGKRTVLVHGNVVVLEARAMQTLNQNGRKGKRNNGGSEGEGRSLTAEVTNKSGSWAWWKVVTMTLGLLGIVGLIMAVVFRK